MANRHRVFGAGLELPFSFDIHGILSLNPGKYIYGKENDFTLRVFFG